MLGLGGKGRYQEEEGKEKNKHERLPHSGTGLSFFLSRDMKNIDKELNRPDIRERK